MDLSNLKIDWNTVEKSDFSVLTAGSYTAKIIKSEMKPCKAGGQMIAVTFELLGRAKGRRLFDNFIMEHSSQQAVQMGLGKLKSIMEAVDVDPEAFSDTSELHGKPFGIKVKVKGKPEDKYGEQNEITSFFEYSEDILEGTSTDSSVQVDEVVVDPVVEGGVVEDEPVQTTEEIDDAITPVYIKALLKKDLLLFIKTQKLDIVIKGKTVGEIKDLAVEAIFGTETIEDDDIVIE